MADTCFIPPGLNSSRKRPKRLTSRRCLICWIANPIRKALRVDAFDTFPSSLFPVAEVKLPQPRIRLEWYSEKSGKRCSHLLGSQEITTVNLRNRPHRSNETCEIVGGAAFGGDIGATEAKSGGLNQKRRVSEKEDSHPEIFSQFVLSITRRFFLPCGDPGT